jgi:hypothetical protein
MKYPIFEWDAQDIEAMETIKNSPFTDPKLKEQLKKEIEEHQRKIELKEKFFPKSVDIV